MEILNYYNQNTSEISFIIIGNDNSVIYATETEHYVLYASGNNVYTNGEITFYKYDSVWLVTDKDNSLLIPLSKPTSGYLLLESGGNILLESGGKIKLEHEFKRVDVYSDSSITETDKFIRIQTLAEDFQSFEFKISGELSQVRSTDRVLYINDNDGLYVRNTYNAATNLEIMRFYNNSSITSGNRAGQTVTTYGIKLIQTEDNGVVAKGQTTHFRDMPGLKTPSTLLDTYFYYENFGVIYEVTAYFNDEVIMHLLPYVFGRKNCLKDEISGNVYF